MTGLFLGTITAAVTAPHTEIVSAAFLGMLVFALGASGFMAETERQFAGVRLRRLRRQQDGRQRRRKRCPIYTVLGEIRYVPANDPDFVEARNTMAGFERIG